MTAKDALTPLKPPLRGTGDRLTKRGRRSNLLECCIQYALGGRSNQVVTTISQHLENGSVGRGPAVEVSEDF